MHGVIGHISSCPNVVILPYLRLLASSSYRKIFPKHPFIGGTLPDFLKYCTLLISSIYMGSSISMNSFLLSVYELYFMIYYFDSVRFKQNWGVTQLALWLKALGLTRSWILGLCIVKGVQCDPQRKRQGASRVRQDTSHPKVLDLKRSWLFTKGRAL